MTSLAAQLQAVASAVPREEKLKGKASLLYELREAADIDLATIYAVGVQGASPRPPAGEALRRRRFTPADTSLSWRTRRDGDVAASLRQPRSRVSAPARHAVARLSPRRVPRIPGGRPPARRPDVSLVVRFQRAPLLRSDETEKPIPKTRDVAHLASLTFAPHRRSRRVHRAVSDGRPV